MVPLGQPPFSNLPFSPLSKRHGELLMAASNSQSRYLSHSSPGAFWDGFLKPLIEFREELVKSTIVLFKKSSSKLLRTSWAEIIIIKNMILYSSTDGGNLALFGVLLRSRVASFLRPHHFIKKRSLGLHVKVGSLLNETSSFVSFVCFVKHQKIKTQNRTERR